VKVLDLDLKTFNADADALAARGWDHRPLQGGVERLGTLAVSETGGLRPRPVP
jgi:hypothetical protein